MRRVGTATLMLVVGGYAIILGITIMMGFYSSLAHSGPKAVLDGAVIALLLHRGRWRCWTLAGVVYAFTLLLLLGNPYVFGVIVMAGLFSAAIGRATDPLGRTTAIAVAAVAYEILAGFGMPIRILLSTTGDEPILWGLWFAEWPLRAIGALLGVWLALRFLRRRTSESPGAISESTTSTVPIDAARALKTQPIATAYVKGAPAAGLRLAMSIVACFLPVMIESWAVLGAIAGAYVIYALWAGLRWRVLHTLAGLAYGWLVFAIASYAWHRDLDRSIDMLRTFALRFAPLALSSAVLVTTVRPVDMVRLLRACFVPAVVIFPLSHVFRGIPQSRREFGHSIAQMRRDGTWRGPLSLFRRPRAIARGLLGPQFRRWADQLAE